MKTFPLSFLLLTILLSVISCKKDEKNNNACINNSSFYKDGARFAYKNTPIVIPADSVFVTLEKITDNQFKSTTHYDEFMVASNYIEICGTKGYQSMTASFENKQMAYDLAAKEGESWTLAASTVSGVSASNTITLTAKDIEVTVPAGKFKVSVFRAVSKVNGSVVAHSDMYITADHLPVKVEGTTAHYELARTQP